MSTPTKAEVAAAEKRRKDLVEDAMYYGGAIVLAGGHVLPAPWSSAFEIIGFFLLLPPLLQLGSAFMRGLVPRAPAK